MRIMPQLLIFSDHSVNESLAIHVLAMARKFETPNDTLINTHRVLPPGYIEHNAWP